jgi:hypothetical protein
MRLKYQFLIDTWAEDKNCGPNSSRQLHLEGYDVQLHYNEACQVSAISVHIPGVEFPRGDDGRLRLPTDFSAHTANAFEVATFFVSLFHYQTGRGFLQEWPNYPSDYLPESDEEANWRKTFLQCDARMPICALAGKGSYDVSASTLTRYFEVRDALGFYVDALKLTDPVSKYRELYRVLERSFPFATKEMAAALFTHLQSTGHICSPERIRTLQDLRNKCSHARSDFVAANDWKGLREIREALPELQEIARLLIERQSAQEKEPRAQAGGNKQEGG